jgi:DNA-binding CsgD family transcriptional regulator
MGNLVKTAYLTPRERTICELMAAGICTNKEIGRKLGVSHRTIEDHRQAVLRKMDVPNAAALVHKILSARIAELEAQYGAN